jgi:hypothetical protein
MDKKMRVQNSRDTIKAAMIAKTAEMTGVTKRSVRRVIAGDQQNETVFSTYMTLLEEFNKLPDAVRALVPID